MSYDPAWDMPQPNWVQQGSFETGAIPPAVAPDAGTPVCIGPVAEEWLPYVQGALDQLKNPSSWIVADDTALYTTLQRVDELRSIIGMATGCCDVAIRLTSGCVLQYSIDGGATWTDVTGWAANFAECVKQATIPTPPLLPPGAPVNQRACNIAGYLANDLIHGAITKSINAYDTNLSLLALAGNIAAITFAFDLPWTAAFIYGVYDLYAYFTAGNIADLRTAEADPVLWADVTCAIYNAIKADGQVTAGNCGAVIAALCALTYTPAVAVTAICAFVTQLGCDGLRSAQVAGVLTTFNCGPCTTGPWCYGWTGASVNMPPWQLVPGDPNTDPSGVFAFSGGAIISKTYGGSRQLHLYMTYPLSTNITQIEVRYSCPEAAGVGSRFVAWEASGAHHGLAGGAGTNVATFAVTANDGYLEIELDSAPAILGQNTITAVYINGTGPCPFGIPNC